MADLIETAPGEFFFPPGQTEGLRDLEQLVATDPWTLASMEGLVVKLSTSIMAAAAPEMRPASDEFPAPHVNQLVTMGGHRKLVSLWPVIWQGLVDVTDRDLDDKNLGADIPSSFVARLPFASGRGWIWGRGHGVTFVERDKPVGDTRVAIRLSTIADCVSRAITNGQPVPRDYGRGEGAF